MSGRCPKAPRRRKSSHPALRADSTAFRRGLRWQHPSRAAGRRAGRGGDARGSASLRFVPSDAGNPCCPASDADVRGSPQPQRRGGLPSEREALWLSKVCTIQVNNLVSVEYSPIRRHRRDPQRRKSSIDSAPAKTASSRSNSRGLVLHCIGIGFPSGMWLTPSSRIL